jgi:hypothetical protein
MESNIIVPSNINGNMIGLSFIQSKIYEIRGYRVMLDFDLAAIYGVENKYLKRSVRSNIERFEGEDFMFELSKNEWETLRCNFCTLKKEGRGQHTKYMPFAFTQLGVSMLSSVLNSDKAIKMNRNIMRAFVVVQQYILDYAELKRELGNFMKATNMQISDIYKVLDVLMSHKKELEKPRTPIGFRRSNEDLI